MEKRDLILCGDIHGEFKELVHKLVVQCGIKNSDVIVLGDVGVGFEKKGFYDHIYDRIKKRLVENNITIYAIRGNHDDPGYFDGEHDYPHLKFVQDHKILELGDLKIYPVGGATSIDQVWRKESMRKNPSQVLWWEGEGVTKLYQGLPTKVDLVVSHDAPLTFDPVAIRESSMITPEIWEDILDTRRYLDYVLKEINTEAWFHGHYHNSSSGDYQKVLYKGLSIMELYLYNI